MEQVTRGYVEYQKGHVNGFYGYHNSGQTIVNGYYVDGLLLTIGSPREHIWTYTGGQYDNHTDIQ